MPLAPDIKILPTFGVSKNINSIFMSYKLKIRWNLITRNIFTVGG